MSIVWGRPSGGGAARWNVVTGIDTPPVKIGGLWAKTAYPIKNIVSNTIRPTIPEVGTLFIAHHSSLIYPEFNPVSNFLGLTNRAVAVQLYTSNGWENVDAYYEHQGQWIQFSQKAFFIYTAMGRTLFKKDRNGIVVWQYEFSTLAANYNIMHITCDWSGSRIFAIASLGTTFVMVRISMDGKEPKIGPSESIPVLYPGHTEALMVPNGTSLVFSPGSGAANLLRNIDAETLVWSTIVGSYSAMSMYMLPSAVGIGMATITGGNAVTVRTYPTWATLGSTVTSAYYVVLKTSDIQFVAFYPGPAASYLRGNITTGSEGTAATPGGRINIYCAANLVNGDVAIGSVGTIDFVTVSGNTLGSVYKTLTIPGTVVRISTSPDGTLWAVNSIGNVFRIDKNDAVTQIGVTRADTVSASMAVAPANRDTFPELFLMGGVS